MTDCPPISLIIFDLGNVLVQVDFSRGLYPYLTGSGLSEVQNNEMDRLFGNELFRDFNRGKVTPLEFYQSLVNRFHLDLKYGPFVQKWCDVFSPMPKMDSLLDKLKKNYFLTLLSDTDPLHWNYCLTHFSYLQKLQKPTLSFETGFLKPALPSYQAVLEKTGYRAQQCLFIDDRPKNVEAARRVGMKAIHFQHAGQLESDLIRLQILF